MRSAPAATSLLDASQLAQVRARSDGWGGWLVLHAWALIAAATWLALAWPNPATWLLAVMVIGSRQLGLVILMHDAAHGALFASPGLNRWVAQLFCAWPMLADTREYRVYHLQHHARTQRDDDPDRILTGHYPISRASLRRKLWRDLSGQTGYAQRLAQVRNALGQSGWPLMQRATHYWKTLGPQTLANLVLLGAATAAGAAWVYAVFWLLPLLTWHQLVLRIRNIAEHAVVRPAEDAFGNARTTLANPLERLFVAPYWVNYHLEHHLVMWVPCYRLPLLRRFLVSNGYGDEIETERGYLAVLDKVTVDAPDNDSGGGRRRASGTFASGFE